MKEQEKLKEQVKKILDYYKKVDFQPFIVSNIFLKDLIYFQNSDYVKNKFIIISNVYFNRLLYNNLNKTKQSIDTNSYLVDNLDINNRYNLKAWLKYDGRNKFITYYNQRIRKMKSEYAKKVEKNNQELIFNFDFNLI